MLALTVMAPANECVVDKLTDLIRKLRPQQGDVITGP
jgi:hypothetical protein